MKQLNDMTGHDYWLWYKNGGNYVLEQLLEKIIEAMYNSADEAEKYWPAHRDAVQTAIENTYCQVRDWANELIGELTEDEED